MENSEPQVRVRVNAGRTSKGAPSYDSTVELVYAIPLNRGDFEEYLQAFSDIVLAESARLEETLKAKYEGDWVNGNGNGKEEKQ